MNKINSSKENQLHSSQLGGAESDVEAEVGGTNVSIGGDNQRSRAASTSSGGVTYPVEFDVYNEAGATSNDGSGGFVVVDAYDAGKYYDAKGGSDSEYESAASHVSSESDSDDSFVVVNRDGTTSNSVSEKDTSSRHSRRSR